MDSSLLSNIQKLFYERIEVFATVEFFKLSIVTGIIKIVLKVEYEFPKLSICILLWCTGAGSVGVCASEDIWQVWSAADAGGLPLPPAIPLEICLRRTVRSPS